uniref:C2 domain-containing protein n=1 Tax=Romanomermis culicivorax TaxID=13658 RepID=A0A915KUG4_ROMCU
MQQFLLNNLHPFESYEETNIYGSPNDSFVRLFFIKNGPKQGWRRASSKSLDFLLEKLIRQDKNGNGGTATAAVPIDYQEFCTKVIRRSSNPVFNEFFYVQNLKDWKKSTSVLKFVLCTTDKYSQTRVAGHCEIHLRKIDAGLVGVQNFCLPMREYNPVSSHDM